MSASAAFGSRTASSFSVSSPSTNPRAPNQPAESRRVHPKFVRHPSRNETHSPAELLSVGLGGERVLQGRRSPGPFRTAVFHSHGVLGLAWRMDRIMRARLSCRWRTISRCRALVFSRCQCAPGDCPEQRRSICQLSSVPGIRWRSLKSWACPGHRSSAVRWNRAMACWTESPSLTSL